MKTLSAPVQSAPLLAGLLLSASAALGSPFGELDPAFGDHGRILLNELRFEEFAGVDGFIDPASGKLLIVADGYPEVALLRFNTDGSLDTSFGDQGAVPLDFGGDVRFDDLLSCCDCLRPDDLPR